MKPIASFPILSGDGLQLRCRSDHVVAFFQPLGAESPVVFILSPWPFLTMGSVSFHLIITLVERILLATG